MRNKAVLQEVCLLAYRGEKGEFQSVSLTSTMRVESRGGSSPDLKSEKTLSGCWLFYIKSVVRVMMSHIYWCTYNTNPNIEPNLNNVTP